MAVPVSIHAGLNIKSRTIQSAIKSNTNEWGWLPALSVVGAVGLLGVAVAYDAAWRKIPSAALQWMGLLVIFVPIALRLFSRQATRRERIGLVLVLGVLLYLVRVFYSPLEFKFSDELQHWRTADDILSSQHLFLLNPLLPISSSYPGLENITSALVSLSGLTIFEAGTLVIGMARLVFVASLYLFYEQVSQSDYVAGLGSLLYMTNPHYQSFDAMFVYQSLALPLAALVLYLEERGEAARGRRGLGWKLILVLSLAAIVATHHITSYAMTAFLVLWTVVALLKRRRHREQPVPGWTTLLALVMILIWVAYVATETMGYLAPTWIKTVGEIARLITQEAKAGETFRAPEGPLQERLISYASVGLISLGILGGIQQIWRRHRANVLAVTLALGSIGYLASIGFRLISSAGAELTGRSWAFT